MKTKITHISLVLAVLLGSTIGTYHVARAYEYFDADSGWLTNDKSFYTTGNLRVGGIVSSIGGYWPTNGAIRLTPNFHLNSGAGNAVILNWDNGTTGGSDTLRIGNGAGSDVFKVNANGRTDAYSNGGNGGYISTGNYGGTGTAAYMPSGIWANGATNWIYGNTYIGTMYDQQNNGYYINMDGASRMGPINSDQLKSYTNVYTDNNYGYGLVGVYDSYRYQGVFAMGDAYKLSADGTSPGSLYGLAWTHTNVGGQSKSGLSHQLLVMHAGVTQSAIGSGIWTNGAVTSLGNHIINNSSPTIYFQDTDHISAMIHNNSNVLYILRGSGVNSTTWATCCTGWWPVYWDMTNNNTYMGGNAYAFAYYYNSDAKFKKDVKPITGALEKINKLNGHYFTWKETNRKDVGVIAQEVQKVFPELVSESEKRNPETNEVTETYLTVEYGNLVAPLIEAVKELTAKVDELFDKYLDQQQQIDAQEKRIKALEMKVDALVKAKK